MSISFYADEACLRTTTVGIRRPLALRTGRRTARAEEASRGAYRLVEIGLYRGARLEGAIEMLRPAKFALSVPRTFTSLNMLKPSPIRLSVTPSRSWKSLRRRRSRELKGLKKLIPPGTWAIGPPALHGLAPGRQAVRSSGQSRCSADRCF